MLNFRTFGPQETIVEDEESQVSTTISVLQTNDQYGEFSAEPLPKGFGNTLGNPLRRALYSALRGTAITWAKIEGVLHEYTTIPDVKEEVSEFLLNVKGIRLRSNVDRPGKLRLEVSGQGEVCAGDMMASSDFEVVNPELHLATMNSEKASLSVEFNVEQGIGYSEASRDDGLAIGVLPIDAVYSPVTKVNFSIENMRVGRSTDFERLIIEIWTDGSLKPPEALKKASNFLIEHFFLFANPREESDDDSSVTPAALMLSPEQYNVSVEQLGLSSRTLNCLKRAGIDTAGKVLENTKEQLLEIRNFGEKSLREIYDRLRDMDLLPEKLDQTLNENPNDQSSDQVPETTVDEKSEQVNSYEQANTNENNETGD